MIPVAVELKQHETVRNELSHINIQLMITESYKKLAFWKYCFVYTLEFPLAIVLFSPLNSSRFRIRWMSLAEANEL